MSTNNRSKKQRGNGAHPPEEIRVVLAQAEAQQAAERALLAQVDHLQRTQDAYQAAGEGLLERLGRVLGVPLATVQLGLDPQTRQIIALTYQTQTGERGTYPLRRPDAPPSMLVPLPPPPADPWQPRRFDDLPPTVPPATPPPVPPAPMHPTTMAGADDSTAEREREKESEKEKEREEEQ